MTLLQIQPGPAPRRAPLRALAVAGLLSKGAVYCLLGIMAIMAAFHIGGHGTGEADPNGVFNLLRSLPAGSLLLAVLAAGLGCYAAWRILEALLDPGDKGKKPGGLLTRSRYLLSGLTYGALAWGAARLALANQGNGRDNKERMAGTLLSHPAGNWLAGAAALLFIGTGIYQIWYGWSEKYRKHVPGASLQRAGKIGYTARGVVWLLIGWLFGRAALHERASEAGDSSKAFQLIASGNWGPWLMATLGAGLICYGVYNFIRARHDRIGG